MSFSKGQRQLTKYKSSPEEDLARANPRHRMTTTKIDVKKRKKSRKRHVTREKGRIDLDDEDEEEVDSDVCPCCEKGEECSAPSADPVGFTMLDTKHKCPNCQCDRRHRHYPRDDSTDEEMNPCCRSFVRICRRKRNKTCQKHCRAKSPRKLTHLRYVSPSQKD
ncbi:uncharacterized protein LOC113389745 [Ctenocephalides felis]|uniref:uncharacterized protein LOC113389745 n=1 Tax=Ctenocephalides felis TaxID=7515 RepID=UPI000E6E2380|nr:uncharacterized protein LOC113389745 [Ctenocephalides felis]